MGAPHPAAMGETLSPIVNQSIPGENGKVLHCDGEMAAVDLRERFSQAMEASASKPEPGMLNILTADLIEFGIGNLASPKIQQELDPWLDGVELLVLDQSLQSHSGYQGQRR